VADRCHPPAITVLINAIGDLLLVISGLLFLLVPMRGHHSGIVELPEFRYLNSHNFCF